MKALSDHVKNYWKNYAIALLLLVVIFATPLANNFRSVSYMSNGLSPMSEASYAQDFVGGSGRGLTKSSIYYDEGDSIESQDRKVVKNANLNLETDSYEGVKSSIKSLAQSHNGIFLWENENRNNDDNRYSSMRIKLDSTKLETFVSEVKALNLEVNSINLNANDVTGSYTDYTKRLERYESQIAKYEALLQKEKITIEEEVQVQTRIDQLEDQIFYLKKRIGDVDEDVSYSEIYISLTEKASLLEEVDFMGFRDLLKNLLSSIQSGIMLLFTLISYLIPIGVIYILYRIFRKKSSK